MAVRAIFRMCDVIPVSDDAVTPNLSAGYVGDSVGMLTPNIAYNKGAGLQRIDSVADTTMAMTVQPAATATVSLVGITATARTLVRVTGKAAFTVTATPNGGSAQALAVVGSVYMPGIYEATFESLSALTITNNSTAAAVLTVTVANVVDYDDGQVSNPIP